MSLMAAPPMDAVPAASFIRDISFSLDRHLQADGNGPGAASAVEGAVTLDVPAVGRDR